jgi:hypothetical protein
VVSHQLALEERRRRDAIRRDVDRLRQLGYSIDASAGGDCPEMLAGMLLHAGVDFTLLDPPEAAESIRGVAERLLRGIA